MRAGTIEPDTAGRKKRRWWFYAAIGAGVLVLAAGVLLVIGVSYWNSLIKTYAADEPVSLPAVDSSKEAQARVQRKCNAFKEAVLNGTASVPLRLSAAELNAVAANLPGLQDRIVLQITNRELQGQFSIPLDKPGQPKLKGKHLNGVAVFKLTFENGWLGMTVSDIDANGKPIPRWILSRIQREDFLKDLQKNVEMLQFFQEIESVEIEDDAVVVTPLSDM